MVTISDTTGFQTRKQPLVTIAFVAEQLNLLKFVELWYYMDRL